MSRVSSRLAPNALAAARARGYVAARCERLPADSLDTVRLLTTKLVSNVLWHGIGDALLDVEIEAGHVTVGVTDSGGGDVTVAGDYRWPEGGRHGLRLVAALSDWWGVEPTPGKLGKRVWFRLAWNARGNQIR